MAENVQTGGLMQFNYDQQKDGSLDPERRNDINLGYAEADERKSKEKRNKVSNPSALFEVIFFLYHRDKIICPSQQVLTIVIPVYIYLPVIFQVIIVFKQIFIFPLSDPDYFWN